MPSAGFELVVPAIKGSQTYVLGRMATGIGTVAYRYSNFRHII